MSAFGGGSAPPTPALSPLSQAGEWISTGSGGQDSAALLRIRNLEVHVQRDRIHRRVGDTRGPLSAPRGVSQRPVHHVGGQVARSGHPKLGTSGRCSATGQQSKSRNHVVAGLGSIFCSPRAAYGVKLPRLIERSLLQLRILPRALSADQRLPLSAWRLARSSF
jgi:hypothetical protein